MSESRRDHLLFLALLGVLTATAFANAAPDALVYDDKFFVPQDSLFGWHSLFRPFSQSLWAATGLQKDLYRPLLLVTLAAEGALHGVRARFFHLTNIALHVAATLLLFELLLALLREKKESPKSPLAAAEADAELLPAFLAALLFGLHPVHTEVVNSIFNRSECLITLGVLGAIWLLWRFGDAHPVRACFAAALLYLAALLCRESAVMLPVLVLCVLVPLRPQMFSGAAARRRLWPASFFLGALALYLLLRQRALSGLATAAPQEAHGERIGKALFLLRDGLRLLFVPYPLRQSYPWEPSAWGRGPALFALAVPALFIGAAWLLRRRQPGPLLGTGFFYLALLPSIGAMTTAERFLYLPSVGLALALALVLKKALRPAGTRRRLVAVIAAVGGIAAIFFVLTAARNADWQSDEALWESEARTAPQAENTWVHLASAYLGTRRYSDVARICDERLRLHPQSARLHMHCAIAYQELRRFDEAESGYRRAIELGLAAPAYANLGRFYDLLGRRQEAEKQYLLAVATEPDEARRHYRRGLYLLRFYPQRAAEARGEFQRALEIQPDFLPARRALEVRDLRTVDKD